MQKTKKKKRCRDGVTCVVLCTLPSIYLVCVVFGTAIPTSFYILENVFHTCTCTMKVLFRCPLTSFNLQRSTKNICTVFSGSVVQCRPALLIRTVQLSTLHTIQNIFILQPLKPSLVFILLTLSVAYCLLTQ